MHAAIARHFLEQANRLAPLFAVKSAEGALRAHDGAQLDFARPFAQVGDVAVYAIYEASFLGGVDYALNGAALVADREHFITVRGQIAGDSLVVIAAHEHVGIRGWTDFACERAVGSESPVLRTLTLALLLESLPSPCLVADEAQALGDDPVHLFPHDQLGQRELLFVTQCAHGFIPELEECATRQRLLVRLDFVLDVELVFVAKRSLRSIGHAHLKLESGDRCARGAARMAKPPAGRFCTRWTLRSVSAAGFASRLQISASSSAPFR